MKKRTKMWLVRGIGYAGYDVVESDAVPWMTQDGIEGVSVWVVMREDGLRYSFCAEAWERMFPHLTLAEGECCEIEVRKVTR